MRNQGWLKKLVKIFRTSGPIQKIERDNAAKQEKDADENYEVTVTSDETGTNAKY